jgi:hypothetical protein
MHCISRALYSSGVWCVCSSSPCALWLAFWRAAARAVPCSGPRARARANAPPSSSFSYDYTLQLDRKGVLTTGIPKHQNSRGYQIVGGYFRTDLANSGCIVTGKGGRQKLSAGLRPCCLHSGLAVHQLFPMRLASLHRHLLRRVRSGAEQFRCRMGQLLIIPMLLRLASSYRQRQRRALITRANLMPLCPVSFCRRLPRWVLLNRATWSRWGRRSTMKGVRAALPGCPSAKAWTTPALKRCEQMTGPPLPTVMT